MDTINITAEQVRAALLRRIDAYLVATGKSDSSVGKEAIKDDKIVGRIRSGENFTIKTYQRLLDWIDAQEPQPTPSKEVAA